MIRRANIETDLDNLYELNKLISSDETLDRLRADLEKTMGEIFVQVQDGAVIGFVSLTFPHWNNIAIILHFSVLEDYRGRGIGSALMNHVKIRAKELGARFIAVDTALWNSRALKFYKNLGFTARNVFADYLGPTNDMVWLDCDLNPRRVSERNAPSRI